MPVVGAPHEVVPADHRGEVADVVQQGSRDERRGRAGRLRQRRRLEHMRRLRHRLAEVVTGAVAGEQVGDHLEGVGGHDPARPASERARTATADSSPSRSA